MFTTFDRSQIVREVRRLSESIKRNLRDLDDIRLTEQEVRDIRALNQGLHFARTCLETLLARPFQRDDILIVREGDIHLHRQVIALGNELDGIVMVRLVNDLTMATFSLQADNLIFADLLPRDRVAR